MNKELIIIFGRPGVGKSTVGKLLSDKLDYNFIDIGSLLRSYARSSNSTLKGKILKNICIGETLDLDDLKIILSGKNVIKITSSSKGLILDGLPRNKEQFECIDELLPDFHSYNKIISILIHSSVQDIYYRSHKISKRLDYSRRILDKRIFDFDNYLLPLINHYKKIWNIYTINNDSTVDFCIQKIVKILNNHLNDSSKSNIENKNIIHY